MSIQSRQAFVMIRTSLSGIPRRFAISASMALSVALVVCVLAGFLSMAKGFEIALAGTGSPSVAVILGGGTNQETGSDIPAAVIRTLDAMTGDIGASRDRGGNLLSSREIVVPVDVKHTADGTENTIALRGMDGTGPSIRDGITLSAGRIFKPGAREIVVGDWLADKFGLSVGDTIRLGAADWTVSGRFATRGGVFESEFWADIDAVRAAFDRQGEVQSLRLRLSEPAALKRLQATLALITGLPLVAVSESDLYAAQSGRTATLIQLLGWPIALLMAIGATAGALNTMMSSVSDRTIDIATVRALGFSRLSAFIGTWVEAMVLAGIGVFLGLTASWLIFNGWQASTIGANTARLAFQLAVTPDVLFTSGILGLAIGILGGAFPAFAATRLPLTAALRARN